MSDAIATIARCPEHGLHGDRSDCFVCGGPVDRVPMISVEAIAQPGPIRAKAIAGMTAELRMGVGLCPDRGRLIAGQLLSRLAKDLVHG